MESHWHWMPEDFFFFLIWWFWKFTRPGIMKWKCKTWKYSLLHNSKGLLIAVKLLSRTPAAAVFSFTTITRRNSDTGGPRVSKKRRWKRAPAFAGRFRVCWRSNTLRPGRWGSSAGSQVARQRAEWPLCFVISQVTHIITLERAGGRALGDAGSIQNAWFSA